MLDQLTRGTIKSHLPSQNSGVATDSHDVMTGLVISKRSQLRQTVNQFKP